MAVIRFQGKTPEIHESVWYADNATITGSTKISKDSSVWFQAVIRGDVNNIIIGERTNIQDGAVVHGSFGKQDTIIGNDVTVGHKAIIHGCIVRDNVLIGMGAIILDGAIIESNTIIAAGAVVTQKMHCESGWIYAGIPAKKVKQLDLNKAKQMIQLSALGYVNYAKEYAESSEEL